ncbi:hypothetical protein BRADI_2g35703v3 [Brachypodium distachyon]|uniref:Uncharacterized protein n=1 Tax=Brachypodium distachyon TaxID=15368 RepID=A0A0Q3MT21_BRADI|nr:hypothetical protein BRADI_2g35703v3 [Brachypodium distachyon]
MQYLQHRLSVALEFWPPPPAVRPATRLDRICCTRPHHSIVFNLVEWTGPGRVGPGIEPVLVPAAPHGPCGPTSRSPVPDSAAWFPSSAGDSFPGTLVTTGLLRPPWSGFPCPAPVELRPWPGLEYTPSAPIRNCSRNDATVFLRKSPSFSFSSALPSPPLSLSPPHPRSPRFCYAPPSLCLRRAPLCSPLFSHQKRAPPFCPRSGSRRIRWLQARRRRSLRSTPPQPEDRGEAGARRRGAGAAQGGGATKSSSSGSS